MVGGVTLYVDKTDETCELEKLEREAQRGQDLHGRLSICSSVSSESSEMLATC